MAERRRLVYLHRSIVKVLKKAIAQTKVVLVTGPRQTGRTTVIHNTFSDYNYITLDDENMLMPGKKRSVPFSLKIRIILWLSMKSNMLKSCSVPLNLIKQIVYVLENKEKKGH